MIRAFFHWLDRNPLVAVWLGLLVCFVLLIAARAWDVSETDAIRSQTISHTGKTA